MSLLHETELNDLLDINLLHDLFGDGGSGEVYNLLLEDGNDFKLEDGGFILVEE